MLNLRPEEFGLQTVTDGVVGMPPDGVLQFSEVPQPALHLADALHGRLGEARAWPVQMSHRRQRLRSVPEVAKALRAVVVSEFGAVWVERVGGEYEMRSTRGWRTHRSR